MNEIRVSVCSYGPDRPLAMRYTDPITGRRVARSTGTHNRDEANKVAGAWEKELREGTYHAPATLLASSRLWVPVDRATRRPVIGSV